MPIPPVPEGPSDESSMYPGDRDMNPEGIGLAALILEDFRTHGSDPLAPGFWAIAVHRIGNARMGIRSKWLRAPASIAYRVVYRGVIAMWGIDLPYNVKIGRRFQVQHHGCVHFGPREAGDDVTVRHSVTVGLLRLNASKFPVIGNRVEIGPGACIVGGIRVGDDCFIAANTVVTNSIPSGSTIIGNPAMRLGTAKKMHRRGPAGSSPPPSE